MFSYCCRHLGAVTTVTFVEDGKRLITTSDDRSLRVWEWDIPVDMKYIADPSMHAMPSVALSPDSKHSLHCSHVMLTSMSAKFVACQSMDNQVVTFTARDRFRPNGRKTFRGALHKHVCMYDMCILIVVQDTTVLAMHAKSTSALTVHTS